MSAGGASDLAQIGVRMVPACTSTTRMPNGATSAWSDSLIDSTARFVDA